MVKIENIYLYVCNETADPLIYVHEHDVELYTFSDYSDNEDFENPLRVLSFKKEGIPGFFQLAQDDHEWEPFDPTWRNSDCFIWCRERDDERAKHLFLKKHEYLENFHRNIIESSIKDADREKRLAQRIYDSKIVEV